jgi:HD-GYP domain-containing protein (c-di-GMP phosphodiesterase class II)
MVSIVPYPSEDNPIGWIELSAYPVKDEQGAVVNVIEYVKEITGRIQAEEQVREHANRIEVLLEIEKAITSTLDLDEVLQIIMSEIQKVIHYDSISLQILQDKFLKVLACRGFKQQDKVIGTMFPLTENFPNYPVITTNETVAFDDVSQEYPHFITKTNQYDSGHIRSWLGIPLVSKETTLGMITIDRSTVDPFTENEIQMATALASQAALAIDNAHLFSEANRRLDQLSSLRKIDQVITNSLDLRLTLEILLDELRQQLEIDAAVVLRYLPEPQTLEFVTSQGFRTQALQFTNLRLGHGFAGKAALERRIIQIPNLTQYETGFLRSPTFREEGFIAYIGVPLIAKGNITGVLEIYHRQPLNPSPNGEWMSFMETLAGQAAIAIDNIDLYHSLQKSNLDLVMAYDATIEGWAQALEMRDMGTEGHSRRVVEMTIKLARKLDISDRELAHIRRGAQLHDIGKMSVPDAILLKPGKLEPNEWEIMRQHPVYAYKWLSTINYLKPALDIPYCHHEKWDGSGYPRGLKGLEIPLAARIFAVVDVWDALGSERPYRDAWSEDQVKRYIQAERGRHFDPEVVDAFFEMVADR